MKYLMTFIITVSFVSCIPNKNSEEKRRYEEQKIRAEKERILKERENQKNQEEQQKRQLQYAKEQFDIQQRNAYASAAYTKLTSKPADFNDDDMYFLSFNKYLTYLRISGTKISDKGLIHIANMTGLKTLDVSNNRIGDEGMKYLGKLENLTSLNLSQTLVTDAGLVELKNLKSLYSISINDVNVTGQGLRHLSRCPITYIYLKGKSYTDEGLAGLSDFSRLYSISLDRTSITGKGFKHLAGLKTLTSLNIYYNPLTYWAGITELKNITSITFPQKTPPDAWKYIAKSSLKQLNLSYDPFFATDTILKALSASKSLTSIYLGGSKYTDAGIIAIAKLPALNYLSINGKWPSNAALTALLRNKELKYLYIYGEAKSFPSIKNTTLESIYINNYNVPVNIINSLVHLEKLSTLSVSLKILDLKYIPAFAKLKNLRSLNVSCISASAMSHEQISHFRQKLSEVMLNTSVYVNCYDYRRYHHYRHKKYYPGVKQKTKK
ncbi:hypothetical protein KKF34_08650 [Myxococcota bacterium]|nr:hypothetical protein [Myxococcota bacterium]MBU1381234.1 hypothetical protein [Myxococcota bacterium]MBU1496933.1 hypothetical protein [Myxococcota bacterium]